MFLVFTLQDQLVALQKHLLRVEQMQRADWLICLVGIQDCGITTNLLRHKLRVWWKTSNKVKICCSKLTLALLWATTFFNPQQMFLLRFKLITQGEKRETSTKSLKRNNVFVALQVDHARWKTRNIDQKLETQQCCATSLEFLYPVFRRLNMGLPWLVPSRFLLNRCCYMTRIEDIVMVTQGEKRETSTKNLKRNNVFVALQVDHARWKTRNIDQKLETEQCCATSLEFLYPVFRRLNMGLPWLVPSRFLLNRCCYMTRIEDIVMVPAL